MKIKYKTAHLLILCICVFSIAAGHVYAAADNVSFDVLYKGQADTLHLARHSLRAADFEVKVWNVDHYEVFAVAPSSVYRGYLQGYPEITVLARVSDSGLEETAVVFFACFFWCFCYTYLIVRDDDTSS